MITDKGSSDGGSANVVGPSDATATTATTAITNVKGPNPSTLLHQSINDGANDDRNEFDDDVDALDTLNADLDELDDGDSLILTSDMKPRASQINASIMDLGKKKKDVEELVVTLENDDDDDEFDYEEDYEYPEDFES